MKLRLCKKILGFLALIVVSGMLMFGGTGEAAPKRIGIAKFDTNNLSVQLHNGSYYDIGLGASDMLTTELAKNKNFAVIEREQIKTILQEQAFGASGAVDDSTAAQIGKIAGVKYMVYGKILYAGAERSTHSGMGITVNQTVVRVQLAVRMIDTTTGAIVWSDQVDGSVKKTGGAFAGLTSRVTVTAGVYDEALSIAVRKIVSAINQQAPLEGYVARVNGAKIYLDIGSEQGVQAGQSFAVIREGEVITNAAGKIIGVEKNDVGNIKVISVESQMSVAEKQEPMLLVIQAGDKVRSF